MGWADIAGLIILCVLSMNEGLMLVDVLAGVFLAGVALYFCDRVGLRHMLVILNARHEDNL